MKKTTPFLVAIALGLTATFSASAQTPIAYWKFDETTGITGTTVKEEMNNLTSTLLDCPTSPFVAGAKGNGLNFSSISATSPNCRVEVSNYSSLEFTTNSFSISTVVKLNKAVTLEQDIVCKGFRTSAKTTGDANTGKWYGLYISSGSSPKYTFAVDDDYDATVTGATGKSSAVSPAIPSTYDGWVHLVGVRNRTTDSLYIYVNGVLSVQSKDNTEQSIASTAYPVTIGSNYTPASGTYITTPTPFAGVIDEVKIFNEALTRQQIAAMFTSYGINSDGTLTATHNPMIRNIQISPNPVTSYITLNNMDDAASFNIFDAQGKLVQSEKFQSEKIDVQQLGKGLYFLQINNTQNNVMYKGRFVKN